MLHDVWFFGTLQTHAQDTHVVIGDNGAISDYRHNMIHTPKHGKSRMLFDMLHRSLAIIGGVLETLHLRERLTAGKNPD